MGKAKLLEREHELEVIARHLDEACEGRGSLLAIEGSAGIGKTSLVEAAIEMGRERSMTIMLGRGGILEHSIEYGVVRQFVEGPVMTADPETQARLLEGAAAPAASVLGFGEPREDLGPGFDPAPDILHSLYWVMVRLSEPGPILAVLDDAHWSDLASLKTSAYVSRRLSDHPIVFISCSRDDEPGSNGDFLSQILIDSNAEILRPAPLSVAAITEILHESFEGVEVSPELVDACLEASGGNPFFLTELIRSLASTSRRPEDLTPEAVSNVGPLAIRRSLLLRLGALGPEVRALAEALAVFGGEAELRHIATMAELTPEQASEASDKMIAAGIAAYDLKLKMVHPLVRAAVFEDIPESKRSDAHRVAYEVLKEDGALDYQLLAHAREASPRGDASVVELMRRSAERELSIGTPDTAVLHLERALAEPPAPEIRAEVLADLGRAEIRNGDYVEGMAKIEAALQSLSGPSVQIDIHRDRAFAAFATGGMERARSAVQSSLRDLGDRSDDEAIQLEADLATLAWLSGGEHGMETDRFEQLEGKNRGERTMLSLLAQSGAATDMHPDKVVELANRSLGGGKLLIEDSSRALSWYMAVYALITCEAIDDARVAIDDAEKDSIRTGSAYARSGALGARALLRLNEGRPVAAEADAKAALAGVLPPIMVPAMSALSVRALVDQGKLDEAEAEMNDAGIAVGSGGPTVLRWIPWARAMLNEARGNLEGVRLDVLPLEQDEQSGHAMRALHWRAMLARVLASKGMFDEALPLARTHLEWAEWWGRPGALGIAQRAFALSSPAEDRVELLETAVGNLSRSFSAIEEAKARLDLGVNLLDAGDRERALAELESSLDLALDRGSRITAEAAAEALKQAGGKPRRLNFDELTASERRVAEYAANGSTNREIADELFVTPKTVENHLTRVYAKLGVGSRRELASVI